MPATEPEPRADEHLERHDLDVARDAGDADAVVRDLRDRAGDVRAVAVIVVRVRVVVDEVVRLDERDALEIGEQVELACSPRSATPVSSTATMTPLPSASFHASGMPIWRMCHCYWYSGSFGKPVVGRARRRRASSARPATASTSARRARRSRRRGAARARRGSRRGAPDRRARDRTARRRDCVVDEHEIDAEVALDRRDLRGVASSLRSTRMSSGSVAARVGDRRSCCARRGARRRRRAEVPPQQHDRDDRRRSHRSSPRLAAALAASCLLVHDRGPTYTVRSDEDALVRAESRPRRARAGCRSRDPRPTLRDSS